MVSEPRFRHHFSVQKQNLTISANSHCVFCTLCYSDFFKTDVSYSHKEKHKGVTDMSPRQRQLAIRLSEKIAKNPEYAKNIGVEIVNENKIMCGFGKKDKDGK